jgi:hypothetical protein
LSKQGLIASAEAACFGISTDGKESWFVFAATTEEREMLGGDGAWAYFLNHGWAIQYVLLIIMNAQFVLVVS